MRRSCKSITLLALFVAAASVATGFAAAQAPPHPKAEQTTITVYTTLQYIKPGLVLSIQVADEPDLSHDYRVGADGQIQITIAGTDTIPGHTWSVPVGGKTADQARNVVAISLKAYMRDPQVQLHIVTAPRLSVEIRGEADKVGIFSLAAETTLSEAMAVCKYHPDADLAHVIIMRRPPDPAPANADRADGDLADAIIMRKPPDPAPANADHPAAVLVPANIHVDFMAFLRGDSDIDPRLANGDVVIIPQRTDKPSTTLQFVRVTGEVNTEASIPWSAGLHVKDVLARAGGLKATADREHVRLIRAADGKIVMVDWSRPDADQSVYNTELSPGDLIIVTRKDQSQSYAVVGEVMVQRRTDYPTGAHIMLSQALHEAGGPSRNGDPHHGILKRGYLINPATARDIPFDPERVLFHQVADVELAPGDVVVVMPKMKRPGFLQQIAPLLLRLLPL